MALILTTRHVDKKFFLKKKKRREKERKRRKKKGLLATWKPALTKYLRGTVFTVQTT